MIKPCVQDMRAQPSDSAQQSKKREPTCTVSMHVQVKHLDSLAPQALADVPQSAERDDGMKRAVGTAVLGQICEHRLCPAHWKGGDNVNNSQPNSGRLIHKQSVSERPRRPGVIPPARAA